MKARENLADAGCLKPKRKYCYDCEISITHFCFMLLKEDIPKDLQIALDGAVDWINVKYETNFELTGLADTKTPTDFETPFELGVVLCDGEICDRKQIRFQPSAAGFEFSVLDLAEPSVPALLDPPEGNRVGWLDQQLEKFEFVLLLYYRGLW